MVEILGRLVKKRRMTGSERLIGIIGAGRSVGVTHFTLMAAGYLSGVLRESCAVLEWNPRGDFQKLGKACLKPGQEAASGPYRILDVDYYRNAGTKELLLCKTSGYQNVLVDYGALEEGSLVEFLRCGRQFVIGSLSEWQVEAFLEFAGDRRATGKGWEALAAFGSEETRKSMEKLYALSIRRIPVSVDAFAVTEKTLEFFQELF